MSIFIQTLFAGDISLVGPRTEKVDFISYKHILYVSNKIGSDREGDGSKGKPWKSIPYALSMIGDAAESNSYAILVSAGAYAEGTIQMKSFVDLYGGFCPKTWKRNIFQHMTVLDGERVRRVVIGASHARIDGFVITRGVVKYHGGGILCEDASPHITNNRIIDNLVLEPDHFNFYRIYQEGYHGGGIACLYNSVPVVKNNLIVDNKTSAGIGGGIAFYGLFRMDGVEEAEIKDNFLVGGVQAVCENNVIIGNTSGVNDIYRTRSSSGGGIACAYEARPFILNNVIAMNRAKGRSDAGGIYIKFFSYPVVEDNWIVGNVSDDDGGGIYTMRLGQPLIKNNFIAGNWTTGGGAGGIRLSKEGRARILDNIIVHNQTGSGLQCIDSYMELEGNIIMDNMNGPGISFWNFFSYLPPSVIRGNIIRHFNGEAIRIRWNYSKPLIVEENNIEGGYDGIGNVDMNPDFIEDGIRDQIHSVKTDPVRYITELIPVRRISNPEMLYGRIIRIDKWWGVIIKAESGKFYMYGVMNTELPAEYEIIPSYRVKQSN
jgi:hypothetical protein